MATTLVYLILNSTRQSRASALSILIFLMATQVHNLLFHVGGTIVFRDFSPGTITAVLLYLPVNIVILRKASEEEWINWKSGVILFLLGGACSGGSRHSAPPYSSLLCSPPGSGLGWPALMRGLRSLRPRSKC